jgi:hypothetical protein
LSRLGPAGQTAIAQGLRAGPARALDLVCNMLTQPDIEAVFASMRWIAEELGVHVRSAFRYSKKLKDKGLWRRDPGNRHVVPKNATKSGRLKSHGYAITNPAPYLTQLAREAREGWQKKRAAKKAANEERKTQSQRHRRQELQRETQAWQKAHPQPEPRRPSHKPFPPSAPLERPAAVPSEAFEAIGMRPKKPKPPPD